MIINRYNPTRVSPPGETLDEILEERGISQKDISLKLGRSDKNISEVINGKAPITPELALDLEKVLGTPASFWNNREANYREWLARQNQPEPTKEDLEWARTFPYSNMANLSWVEAATTTKIKFYNLLKFFGVVDRKAFTEWQASLRPQYRRSLSSENKDNLIAAWLRQGEIEAFHVETEPYSEQEFGKAVTSARKLTRQNPENFMPELRRIYAHAGVALLLIPELPSMGVHGATRWLRSKPIIQVTLLRKTSDHFWFTIFHESCHILKHSRRSVFLEDAIGTSNVQEAEANEFAENVLIPVKDYKAFVSSRDFNEQSIRAFANSNDLCPGVVVGRLQRDQYISFDQFNSLKTKFDWNVT